MVGRTCRVSCILSIVLAVSGPVRSVAAVSFRAERDLGREFDLAVRREVPMITDPEVTGYVEGIGKKIAATLEDSFFDYHFAVIRDPSINAFAVPGGYVYVHSGLLCRAANDDEVAGVLGHEIAHIHAHHLARQQEATQLMNYATLLGVLLSVVQPAIAPLMTGANAAVSLKYRREFEQEADYLSVRHLRGTGYDPRAMLDFFKKLSDDQRTQPTLAPAYLQSHPLTDERLNHLEAILRTQQWSNRERRPAGLPLLQVQALARSRTEPPLDVVASYRQKVEESPDDPVTRYLFGLVALEANQLDRAEEALEMARAAGVAAAERDLGRVALRRRKPEQARTLLTQYVQKNPNDARAEADLAQALEILGDAAGAMAGYRRALEIAPGFEWAHRELGLLAGKNGDEAEGYFQLATAARLGGEYDKALTQYARARDLLPAGDPRAEEARGYVEELSEFLRVEKPATGNEAPQAPPPRMVSKGR